MAQTPWPRVVPAPTLRTADLEGARCVGRWWLFDSIDPDDHAEAAKECAICPVRDSCLQVLQEVAGGGPRASGPVGTWAGLLVGTSAKPREHGTERGWGQHRHYRETACEDCYRAHAEHVAKNSKMRAEMRAKVHVNEVSA